MLDVASTVFSYCGLLTLLLLVNLGRSGEPVYPDHMTRFTFVTDESEENASNMEKLGGYDAESLPLFEHISYFRHYCCKPSHDWTEI